MGLLSFKNTSFHFCSETWKLSASRCHLLIHKENNISMSHGSKGAKWMNEADLWYFILFGYVGTLGIIFIVF